MHLSKIDNQKIVSGACYMIVRYIFLVEKILIYLHKISCRFNKFCDLQNVDLDSLNVYFPNFFFIPCETFFVWSSNLLSALNFKRKKVYIYHTFICIKIDFFLSLVLFVYLKYTSKSIRKSLNYRINYQ